MLKQFVEHLLWEKPVYVPGCVTLYVQLDGKCFLYFVFISLNKYKIHQRIGYLNVW